MDDLFDLLLTYREWNKRDRNQEQLGGLLQLEEQTIEDVWRPNDWSLSIDDTVAWPGCLQTVRTTIIVLKKGKRWSDKSTLYRAGCLKTGWTGEPHRDKMLALAEGLDFGWPGWWSMPIVNRMNVGKEHAWAETIARMYPPGWFETGGPVRTNRASHDTEPHAGQAPGGGWDVAGVLKPKEEPSVLRIKMLSVPSNSPWQDYSNGSWNDLIVNEQGDLVNERFARVTTQWDDQDDDDDEEWDDDDD